VGCREDEKEEVKGGGMTKRRKRDIPENPAA